MSSILASLASTATGVQVLASQNLESIGAQVMGFDPFIILGLATAACGALGWLAGPVLGNAIWRLVYRKYKGAVAVVCCHFSSPLFLRSAFPAPAGRLYPYPDFIIASKFGKR
jgi:import inner membrane translocase subunit TIM23